MFKTLSTLLLLLISLSVFSQDFSLVGTVVDENNQPVSFANLILLIGEDSAFVNGTTTNEEGVFKIENLEGGNYILKVSFLGFKTVEIPLDLNKNLDLHSIILNEEAQALDDVIVVAKRPTIKRMVDRLVFNVENSTLSNGNVLDVLKNTPGILVHDGEITIKNASPTVYINDRRVHLSASEVLQLLEGTSAGNIKTIEVITNPPAKYEAEGGAVLNIITSKNIVAGYNGSVFGNYKQGSEYPKYSFGTSHFFKTKKLNTYLNYNISPRKDFRNNHETYNFFDNNNQVVSKWGTNYNRTSESSNQNINANIDYDIDKNNSLSFSTNMLISPRQNTGTSVNSKTDVYNANGILDSLFITDNRLVDETFNLAFTLDYNHKFKREGEKLSVNAHHTNYDFSSFQNVGTDYLFPDESLIRTNRFQTFSSQIIKLYTGQLDYELPFSDSAQFETGVKVSNINSESILNQFNFDNGSRVEDLENSDTFLYDETNYAAYASYSKEWEAWSFKSGLRVELTDIKGNSLSSNQINNSDYLKFFPSFYILNRINENNEFYFNYNKRIHRPRYKQLNPFKYFLNDNTYRIGDPNLKPQIDDVFTLGYTFNKNYTFELYYRYENKPALEIIFQDNEANLIKRTSTNIDRSISYGLDFTTYTQVTDNWNVYALSSLFYYKNQFFALESNNELETLDKWSVYAQIINYFTFSKDKSLTADVAILYLSPLADGAGIVSERWGLDINLRKTLWNNRASMSIGVTDIFNTQNFTQSTKYLNQDGFMKSSLENRLLTIGFNYKFGNFRLNNNKKNIELDERDRLD